MKDEYVPLYELENVIMFDDDDNEGHTGEI